MGLHHSKVQNVDTITTHDEMINKYKSLYKHFIMNVHEVTFKDNSTYLLYETYVVQDKLCLFYSEMRDPSTFRLTNFTRCKVTIGQVTPTMIYKMFDPSINSTKSILSYTLNAGVYRDLNTNIISYMNFKQTGSPLLNKPETKLYIHNGLSDNTDYNSFYNLFDPEYDTVNNVVRL